ncbi:MAG: LamG-like jellyroll fold domain-containing protein [Sedimentisphaerales bacterium]|nr:LamG-like jellyroll fold domain-containing protein [Sedimentisphaerales bacterium]
MKVLKAIFVTVVLVCVCAGGAFATINTALQFDGINDFVSVPDSDALSPQIVGDMTLSAWVKLDTLPLVGETLVSKGTDYYYEYNLGVQPDGRVNFAIWRPTGSHFVAPFGGIITVGQWHNIAGVYKKGMYAKLYLDGILVAQVNTFNPPIANGPGKLCFGKTDNPSTPWLFKGAIDEIQLWNCAKTDAEIQANLHEPLQGDEPNLVAYWSFNEGTGQTTKDVSGHGHDGTLGSSSNPDSADPLWVTADGTPHFNTAPTANAGADQRVYAGLDGMAAVALDGSDSNDPQNDTLTYVWSYTIGGQVYEANGVKPALTLPVGTQTITLVVNDGEYDSEPDDVNVTVIGPLKVNVKFSPVLHWQPWKLLTAQFAFPAHLDEQIDPYSIAFAADPNVKADYFDLSVYRDSILGCNVGFANVPVSLAKPNTMTKIFGSFRSGRLFYGEDKIKVVRPGLQK